MKQQEDNEVARKDFIITLIVVLLQVFENHQNDSLKTICSSTTHRTLNPMKVQTVHTLQVIQPHRSSSAVNWNEYFIDFQANATQRYL